MERLRKDINKLPIDAMTIARLNIEERWSAARIRDYIQTEYNHKVSRATIQRRIKEGAKQYSAGE